MSKKTLLLSLGLVLMTQVVFIDNICGKNRNETQNPLPSSYKTMATRPEKAFFNHTTNNLWSAITNYGSVGDPNSPSTGRPSAQWPGGSGNNYLYDAGLWLGTKIGGEPVVTTYFYNPHVEYLPTSGFSGEIGAVISKDIHGNENTKSRSLEDSYMVYDDMESHTESNHSPLGLKVVQRGLTWSLPEFDDFIAFEYFIINTGLNGYLEDVYVAYWYDIDVSSSDDSEPHIDDLVDYDGWDGVSTTSDLLDVVDPFDLDNDGITGYDEWGVPYLKDAPQNPNFNPGGGEPDGFYDEWAVLFDEDGDTLYWQKGVSELGRIAGEPAILDGELLKGYQFPRSVSYIYDGDHPGSSANDYGEREKSPPNEGFLGGSLIYTSAPKNIVGNVGEEWPFTAKEYMGAFSHQWWNWESDPMDLDGDKMDYMLGQHVASQGKRFLDNPLVLGYPQFDYRFLLTTGPFDIPEGDTVKIVFALTCGKGLEGLRQNSDNAIKAYYSGSQQGTPYNPNSFDEDVHWNLPIPPEVPELSYSPMSGGVRLAWDTRAEFSFDANLGRIDFEGYQVYRASYNPQDWEMIAAFDNREEPIFVVDVNGDTLNNKAVAVCENLNFLTQEPCEEAGWEWTFPQAACENLNFLTQESCEEAGWEWILFQYVGDWILLDLPIIQNQFEDVGGVNTWGDTIDVTLEGIPYYYAVSAYDGYKSAEEAGQELLPSYSPLSNYKKSADNAPIPVFPGTLYETGDTIPPIDRVLVVPNPYRGTAEWEVEYEDRIKFTNLPPVAKISIFSLSGDLIKEIEHTNGQAEEYWDLITRNNQSVVSGLYVYVVEAPDINIVGESSKNLEKYIGKFAIFR